MKRKFLVLSLSTLLILSPSVASAEDLEISDNLYINNEENLYLEDDLEISDQGEREDENLDELEISEDEGENLDKLEVSGMREGLNQAQSAVRGIKAYNDEEKELLNKYNEAVEELDRQVSMLEEKENMPEGAVGGAEILDVKTIPTRIQLLIRIGRAIRFGTTELSNKVVGAHTKLAEYVTTGILYTLNPFASSDSIMDYINQWEGLEEELLSYPDLSPEDIATIYKKAGVSRKLAEARRIRNENKRFKGASIKKLEEPIRKTSALLWRINVTCGELDDQLLKLDEAIERIVGPKIRAEEIVFMEGDGGYIQVDQKTKIRPVIRPEEVKNKDYILYSSNSYLARVEGDEIIPLATGNVDIIAVAKDNGIKKKFNLRIVNPGEEVSDLPRLDSTGDNNINLEQFYE